MRLFTLSLRSASLAVVAALVVGLVLGSVLQRRMDRPANTPAVQVARQATERSVREAARADTVLVRDTVRLVRWLTRYDTARVTDTVTHDRVVYVRLDVADSTVRACRAVVTSCSAALAGRDSVIASLRREMTARVEAERDRRPSLGERLLRGTALLGAGVVAGVVLTHTGTVP